MTIFDQAVLIKMLGEAPAEKTFTTTELSTQLLVCDSAMNGWMYALKRLDLVSLSRELPDRRVNRWRATFRIEPRGTDLEAEQKPT